MSNRDLVLQTIRKKGPQTTAELAEVSGLSQESQRSLCEMLEKRGALKWDGDKWSAPSATAAASADPHRAKILAFLSDGPKSVSEVIAHLGIEANEVRKALRRAENAGDAQTEGWARAARWSLCLVRPKKRPAKAAKPAKAAPKRTKPAKATRKAKSNGHVPASLNGDLKASDDRVLATIDAEIARSFQRIERLKSARELIEAAGA